MSLPITSLTAALATIMMIVLSVIVSLNRGKVGVDHGDGGHGGLLLRIRAHGNFIETVPMALILLGLCEAAGHGATLLWTMALLLLVGRFAHAMGTLGGKLPLRAGGMLLTFLSLGTGAVRLLLDYFG